MEFSLEIVFFRPLAAVQLEAPKLSFSHDGQKIFDFLLPHVSRMPQTVPFHEHAHRLHIGLLGAQAIVFVTNSHTALIQQPCGAQHRRTEGFMAESKSVFIYSTNTAELGYKPLSAFISFQFIPQAPDMACGLVRSTLH